MSLTIPVALKCQATKLYTWVVFFHSPLKKKWWQFQIQVFFCFFKRLSEAFLYFYIPSKFRLRPCSAQKSDRFVQGCNMKRRCVQTGAPGLKWSAKNQGLSVMHYAWTHRDPPLATLQLNKALFCGRKMQSSIITGNFRVVFVPFIQQESHTWR